MRRLAALAVLSFGLAGSAFATCPTPAFFCGYTQDRACYTTSGNVTNSGIGCNPGQASWTFGSGNSYAQASFTIGPNDCIINPDHFYIGSFIEFSSPGGTPQDNFEINIDVTHPNNTVSRYTLLYWSGAYGSLTDCGMHDRYFTATNGDTVLVTIRSTNSGNATLVVSVPQLGSNP